MKSTLVMTSAWQLDVPAQACWPLIADARRWPSWWQSILAVADGPGQVMPPRPLWAWRALLGLPLRLRTLQRRSDPGELIEWQVEGDMRATLTFVLSSAPPGGCELTCRWELEPVFARPDWLRSLGCLLLERSHFGRMRACARDLAARLGCRSGRLREWSGLTRR